MRVALADDHYLVREGVRRLLESSGEVDVVAAVGDRDGLIQAVAQLRPDAVITDIRMPPDHGTEGIEAARRIGLEHPEVGVVVLSQHLGESYALELLADGAEGRAYLLKERVGDLQQLMHALREVIAGRSVIDPLVIETLMAGRTRREGGIAELSERELDVLRAMAEGQTNAGIAAKLAISESAVEKHITSIFDKLALGGERGVHRRVAAVLAYLRDSGGWG